MFGGCLSCSCLHYSCGICYKKTLVKQYCYMLLRGKPVGDVKTIFLCLIEYSHKLSDKRQSQNDKKSYGKLKNQKTKTCKTPL